MERQNSKHKLLTVFISAVWLVNGLYCKVLNFVPRHQQIVAQILGETHAGLFTKAIGASEIIMAIWIISGYKSKLCAVIQIVVIAMMNCIEFLLVPNLLLFGRFNALLACTLIAVIYYNEFHTTTKQIEIA